MATEPALAASETEPEDSEDRSGRSRLLRNVLSSWSTQLVFVASGFIMPRFIDRSLGAVALGVWDFGWSLVTYFGWAQIGVGIAVSRYVAKHRVDGDVQALRRTVSSGMFLQMLAAGVALAMTAAAVSLLPPLFGQRLGSHLGEARWVVALLGASIAVQLGLDAFHGVLTGHHRWDLHNAISAGAHALTVGAMLAALATGAGLKALAAANLCGTVLAELARATAAYRVCPDLLLRPRYVTWSEAKQLWRFGGKHVLNGLARLVLNRSNSVLIAAQLGPLALARYARSDSLSRQAEVFMNKFAFVLTPTASSLQASGRKAELGDLFLDSSRYVVLMAFPIALVLAILGGPLIAIWMGPQYQESIVVAVLAFGYFMSMSQQPAARILMGLNLHGQNVIVSWAAALSGVTFSLVALRWLGWGLPGAALGMAIPNALGNGIVVPAYACRKLGMHYARYVRHAMLEPVAYAAPFAASLGACRFLLGDRPLLAVVCGGLSGVLTLLPVYWRYALPVERRDRIASELRSKMRALLGR